jgi:hypothetical protein
MPPSSDIILIGAGRSPHTKQLRQKKKPARRNPWIGTVQILTGMRFPVDVDFLKANFKAIVEAVESGVLLVEYKFDKYVDPEELEILAYGSTEEREAYEKEASQALEAKAVEQTMLAEERSAAIDDDLRRSVMSNMPIPQADSTVPEGTATETPPEEGPEGTANPDNATRFNGGPSGTPPPSDAPELDNLQGSHESTITSPRDVADEAQREATEGEAPRKLSQADDVDGLHPNQVADEQRAEEALEEAEEHDDPEYNPGEINRSIPEGTEYKPLPEGWKSGNKTELLGYCAERGIDTSDMPSNKELRKRLDGYGH